MSDLTLKVLGRSSHTAIKRSRAAFEGRHPTSAQASETLRFVDKVLRPAVAAGTNP